MKYSFLILLIFGITISTFSQFFEFGQEPASVKWKHAHTENFKLIFPSGYESNVPKLLWHLEESYELNSGDYNRKPKKIPVVVHNHSVVSNGFLALAPRRMELFVHPDPNGYAGDRFRQLTLHEMRHVSQVDMLNQGFTRLLSIFTGEQANAIAAAMLPFWLLEGDAILAETIHTHTGRGRLPSFEKEIKAILLDQKRLYSYDKSYFGSYKDFIPDYYRYGFQIAAHAKNKYGDNFWIEAVNYTGEKSWLASPLSFYIKKETGLNRTDFYAETMSFIENKWKKSSEKREIHKYEWLGRKNETYTSYSYPHILEDSSIIAVKTGLDIIPSFTRIGPDGTEKILFTPGSLFSGRISIKRSRILWDEYVPDPRWGNRSYSELKLFNYETGIRETLTRNTRFSAPAFSFSGDTIIAIETDPQQQIWLVLLSAENGEYFKKVPSPNNVWLQYPEWIEGTSFIAVIASDEKGKKILSYNRDTDSWQTLFYSGFHDIHDIKSHDDKLLFRGSFSGTDDIYALDYKTGNLFRFTYSRYGAYYPGISPNGKEVSFSEYTSNGYKPVRIPNDSLAGNPVGIETLQLKEQSFFQTRHIPEEELEEIMIPENFNPEIKKYSKMANLFRFHSWVPFYFDYSSLTLENPDINPGVSITSQNTLSTAFTTIGYEYSDDNHFLKTSFIYKGIYPVISFSSSFGGSTGVLRGENDPELTSVRTNENYSLLTYIPLNFTSGKFITGIQPLLKLNYSGNYFYYQTEGFYKRGMVYTEPRLYLYSYLRRAHRDLQPKLGLIMDGRSLFTPFEKEQLGVISSLKTIAFLPGLMKNQGIKLQAQFQKQNTEKYLYNNQVSFPRGYNDLISIGLKKYSTDYIFPLLYPDIRIGSIFYLKRIHANIFYDYMLGKDVYEIVDNERVVSDKTLSSYGVELFFEYHFLRLLFPFIQGVRMSYLPERAEYKFEGIFRIDLGRF